MGCAKTKETGDARRGRCGQKVTCGMWPGRTVRSGSGYSPLCTATMAGVRTIATKNTVIKKSRMVWEFGEMCRQKLDVSSFRPKRDWKEYHFGLLSQSQGTPLFH